MKSLYALPLCLLLLLYSCNDNGTCVGNIACTEEFRIITIEVVNTDGNPVLLDSSYTVSENSELIYFENDELFPGFEGTYTIWSDAEFDLTKKKGSDLTFEGWIDNEKVVSESFVVGHDCCHVELLEGPSEIVLK